MKESEQNSFDYMSSPLSTNNLPQQQRPGGLASDFGIQTGLNRRKLSQEQISKLINQLSMEDKAMIQQEVSECNSKKLYTRSLPAAAIFTAGLQLVREKFYFFGPKNNTTFFLVFGTSSFIVANVYSMFSCAKLVAPMLPALYEKYNSGNFKTPQESYDTLRSANRSAVGVATENYDSLRLPNLNDGSLPTSEWETSSRPLYGQKKPMQTNSFEYEDANFVMSGTPLGKNGTQNKYGDDLSKNKFE